MYRFLALSWINSNSRSNPSRRIEAEGAATPGALGERASRLEPCGETGGNLNMTRATVTAAYGKSSYRVRGRAKGQVKCRFEILALGWTEVLEMFTEMLALPQSSNRSQGCVRSPFTSSTWRGVHSRWLKACIMHADKRENLGLHLAWRSSFPSTGNMASLHFTGKVRPEASGI